MKISKDECDKEFANINLFISDEKCGECEFLNLCPYMYKEIESVVERRLKGVTYDKTVETSH